MYGYSEFIPLTEEEVLKRVTQDEIIEMAIGYKPVPYQFITSPIKLQRGKQDTKPGARFEWWNDKLFFIDFGDNPSHRVYIRFIMDFYNVNFDNALRIINTHFGLGLGHQNDEIIIKPVLYETAKAHQNQERQRTHIIYRPRPLGVRDKPFWNPYKISKEQLIQDEVMAVQWYKFFSHTHQRWIVINPRDVCYVYTEWKERVKIYRPFAKLKFLTNCAANDVGGYRSLPQSGKILVITKAYKDYAVLTNQTLTSVWFQNEGILPSDEIIIDLCERFDDIYIWFDNDEPGIKASFKLTAKINSFYPAKALPIWLPEELLLKKIKDPSDLQKNDQKQLEQFITQKGLYGNSRYSSDNSPFMA